MNDAINGFLSGAVTKYLFFALPTCFPPKMSRALLLRYCFCGRYDAKFAEVALVRVVRVYAVCVLECIGEAEIGTQKSGRVRF